jgi:hypothetical protein
VHVLHINLTGAFWREIDQVLEGTQRKGMQATLSRNEAD